MECSFTTGGAYYVPAEPPVSPDGAHEALEPTLPTPHLGRAAQLCADSAGRLTHHELWKHRGLVFQNEGALFQLRRHVPGLMREGQVRTPTGALGEVLAEPLGTAHYRLGLLVSDLCALALLL